MVGGRKKTDTVHESNEEYRLLVENANEAILVAQDGVFVFSNPKAEALFGYSRAELESQRLANFVHEADSKMVREQHERILRGETLPDVCSFRIQCKSGQIKWVDLKVALFPWKNRPAVLYCMTDITEQKLAEEALRQSEERFRMLFKYHSAVMLVVDPETGIIIDANEAAESFYGYSIDELKTKCIQQIDVLSSGAVEAGIEKSATSNYDKAEFRHRRADGSIRDVEVFSNKIEISGKSLLYSIVHDITDRRLAEESVLDSEKRFRAAFMGSPAALAITTQDGGVWIDANQTELAMFGYTREGLMGKSVMDTNLWVDLKDREAFVDALAKHGEVRNKNVQLRRKDGRLISASVSANSLVLKGVKHILFATEDITERKLSEERIKQSLKEKEILLREIHHRVKNNLAVISSLLGLQAHRTKENAVKEMMDACQLRIKSMALVHEKMYCNQDVSRVNFKEYINSIVQDLTSSYHDEKRNIVIRISVRDILLDIETATPCGMIINELITNVLKHAFSETISPELFISFEKADNTYTLMVQDNGVGLPDDYGSSSTNTLGLLLVRALTRQLRGTVRFFSDASVRQGTTVVFSFEK